MQPVLSSGPGSTSWSGTLKLRPMSREPEPGIYLCFSSQMIQGQSLTWLFLRQVSLRLHNTPPPAHTHRVGQGLSAPQASALPSPVECPQGVGGEASRGESAGPGWKSPPAPQAAGCPDLTLALRHSLLLPAGDLGAQGLPRVAATHDRPTRVRARLPSPGELQRVLPAVPRHALGRRRLLSRRSGRGAGAHAPEPPEAPGRAHPRLSQGRRPCAAWSTCSRASATSRATRARRSSGWARCTRARARSGCWWRWRRSACSCTSSPPRRSDGFGRCCPGPEKTAAGPAAGGEKPAPPGARGGLLASPTQSLIKVVATGPQLRSLGRRGRALRVVEPGGARLRAVPVRGHAAGGMGGVAKERASPGAGSIWSSALHSTSAATRPARGASAQGTVSSGVPPRLLLPTLRLPPHLSPPSGPPLP
ncbi:leukotriene C4 synthase isoform X1 [Lemur catta]|uniref:leukotriene C4 synthase isoform X1 n=1 Tax=Lemur catta TaxID=9447 RepID=UPI001E26A44E|nr:leukotriene C4 synthase isoform X1 [Lemur catta]